MKKDEYNTFLKLDLSPYSGEWVALCDNKVISHGKQIKPVFYKAKKMFPKRIPELLLVPGKEKWLF